MCRVKHPSLLQSSLVEVASKSILRMTCTAQDDAAKFLKSFLEEFPNPLGTEDPLPVSPLSRKVSLQEVKGESLDLGLRLLSARFVMCIICISSRSRVSKLRPGGPLSCRG